MLISPYLVLLSFAIPVFIVSLASVFFLFNMLIGGVYSQDVAHNPTIVDMASPVGGNYFCVVRDPKQVYVYILE